MKKFLIALVLGYFLGLSVRALKKVASLVPDYWVEGVIEHLSTSIGDFIENSFELTLYGENELARQREKRQKLGLRNYSDYSKRATS